MAGTYPGPDGRPIKVAPLTDEDRRTVVRWIDLGCPIDIDFDPKNPERTGRGWMADDLRPTLTLAYPRAGANESLSRILVGMHDTHTGLDADSFTVTADFPIGGAKAGENLAAKFKSAGQGVWAWTLSKPLAAWQTGTLTVSVTDRQGNVTRVERTFSVGPAAK